MSRSPAGRVSDSISSERDTLQRLAQATDWSTTALGPVGGWPIHLHTLVRSTLASAIPINVIWGPGRVQVCNGAFQSLMGSEQHLLGRDFLECWQSSWPAFGDAFERVSQDPSAGLTQEARGVLRRGALLEEVFLTSTFSPIAADDDGVAGVLQVVSETTGAAVARRRSELLRTLAIRSTTVGSLPDLCAIMGATFEEFQLDVPFAALYLIGRAGRTAHLAASAGLGAANMVAAATIQIRDAKHRWPFEAIWQSTGIVEVPDLSELLPWLIAGSSGESPRPSVILPVLAAERDSPAGFAVLGLSARRPLDAAYREFLAEVRETLTASFTSATRQDQERERSNALAELDKDKTLFFSNVSREFRTPLTLLLGLLEEEVRARPEATDRLHMAHRNALRLLKLVDTLLDFSRLESGRHQGNFERIDLAALTLDLASVFRATIERAGLSFWVDCPPLPDLVYVDRRMWEKAVLNLLANAFKFTFHGEIAIALRWHGDHVALVVQDTGVGIPADERPRVFDRFYRGRATRARFHEGTGIGLTVVREVIRLHGGTVEVESAHGYGTTFVATVRTGVDHLPADRIVARSTPAAGTDHLLEEAIGWLPSDEAAAMLANDPAVGVEHPLVRSRSWASARRATVICVEDNADLRDYIERLLGPSFQVETIADGGSALEAIGRRAPDLVLADAAAPALDGFQLLRALRANPMTANIPVILLSADAGDDGRIDALAAGADDYLIKPFSARELVARVDAHVRLSRLRLESNAALRASEARLRRMINIQGIGVTILAEDGVVLEANDAFIRRFGYSREEVAIGALTWRKLTPPEYVPITEAQIGACVETGSMGPYEKEYICKDRTRLWMIVVGASLGDGSIVEYCIDINAQKIAEAEVKELFKRLLTVQEDERRRIARDMHDQLGQQITALRMHIEALHPNTADQPSTAERAARVSRLAEELDESIDFLTWDLRPAALDHLGLSAALSHLVRGWSERFQIAAEYETSGLSRTRFKPEVEINLYRVAQEALHNVFKHARAGRVGASLRREDDDLVLLIEDDGHGYDTADVSRRARGSLGLPNMRERVALLGGTLEVKSSPERGTSIVVRIPMDRAIRLAGSEH